MAINWIWIYSTMIAKINTENNHFISIEYKRFVLLIKALPILILYLTTRLIIF